MQCGGHRGRRREVPTGSWEGSIGNTSGPVRDPTGGEFFGAFFFWFDLVVTWAFSVTFLVTLTRTDRREAGSQPGKNKQSEEKD